MVRDRDVTKKMCVNLELDAGICRSFLEVPFIFARLLFGLAISKVLYTEHPSYPEQDISVPNLTRLHLPSHRPFGRHLFCG
jgi:hypothetical protein